MLLAEKETKTEKNAEKNTKTTQKSTETVTDSAKSSGTTTNSNTNSSAANTNTTANANTADNSNTNTQASTQAPSSTPDPFKNVDLSNPSWDMMIVIFFIVSTFLYGWSLGRDRIIIMLVSIYMALTVVQTLPDFVLNVKLNDQFAFQLTTFVALFVALFFFISRSALLRTLGAGVTNGKWYQTIIFSILHVGLLISITMSFLPPEFLSKFSPLTQTIFRNEWAAFGWIIAPILAMVVFGGAKKEE